MSNNQKGSQSSLTWHVAMVFDDGISVQIAVPSLPTSQAVCSVAGHSLDRPSQSMAPALPQGEQCLHVQGALLESIVYAGTSFSCIFWKIYLSSCHYLSTI